jgi:hypothetical protein
MTKIVTVLLIVATLLSAFSMVFGVEIPGGTTGGYANTGLSATVGNIIGIVQFICYAAAVILLVMLGIKFMTASPDGKAEVKKSAVIYVVGAILVFATGLLLNLIKNVANNTVQTGNGK